AVVHTGSSEARSACGTKVIVFWASPRTIRGAASPTAPMKLDFRKSRRLISAPARAALSKFSRNSDQPLAMRRAKPVVCADIGAFGGDAPDALAHRRQDLWVSDVTINRRSRRVWPSARIAGYTGE